MSISSYYNAKIKGLSLFDICSRINNKFKLLFWRWFFLAYRLYFPIKIQEIKKKQQVRVLFVIAELGAWKTESLYLAMHNNKKFLPVLGVTKSLEVPGSELKLKEYLDSKNYEYKDLDIPGNDIDSISPDLIFYYKPYDTSIPRKHIYKYHLRSLPCFINYAFNSQYDKVTISDRIFDYSIFQFVENKLVAKAKRQRLGIRAHGLAVTGVPMQDALIGTSQITNDPWKDHSGKKRIIYAPHHSFSGTNDGGVVFATFLIYGEFILQLAEKYKQQVCFAFKPHPTLYVKLCKIWGKEKTDEYYEKWANMENTQLELGYYSDLFRFSDAMIHDCCSFIIEYLYTQKPVLFLQAETIRIENFNDFSTKAFSLHIKAIKETDIENFIQTIIDGIDPLSSDRRQFYEQQLLPPNGTSASENIIAHICNSIGIKS